MAFGFPAYHEEIINLNISKDDSQKIILKAFKSLNIPFSVKDEYTITSSTPTSILSFGFNISLRILEDGSIFIKSSCALPTQCIDFGTNQENVSKIKSAIIKAK